MKGKWFVVVGLVVIAANLALFFWARESYPGCFLTKDEVAARWGAAPASPEAFRSAPPEGRAALVHGLLSISSLLGKPPSNVEEALGPPDARFVVPEAPAYRIDAPGEPSGWTLVFALRGGNVREAVVWRKECP